MHLLGEVPSPIRSHHRLSRRSPMTAEMLILIVLLIAIMLYAILAGADFGAGIWEVLLKRPLPADDRKLIDHAIGPVWEANHVWLIFALIATLNGFPKAFATLSQALWLPWVLALTGIIFRGVAFVLKSVPGETAESAHPLGAGVRSSLRRRTHVSGSQPRGRRLGKLPLTESGDFDGNTFYSWLNLMAAYSAVLAIRSVCLPGSCISQLGNAARWSDGAGAGLATPCPRDWRRHGALVPLGLVLIYLDVPQLWMGFRKRAWPLVLTSLICGSGALVALFRAKPLLAAICAAGAVASVMAGWGVAQYPILSPTDADD